MSAGQIIFYVLAVLAAVSAVMVVGFGKDPVRSAVSLVLNFLTLALIYFMLGAQFLGITQILVYAGAIMVLFLFVIMILKLGKDEPNEKRREPVPPMIGVLLGLGIFVAVFFQIAYPLFQFGPKELPESYGGPQEIGRFLFSQYVWPFEVASILLLVGIIGSILLAKRRI